jgi:iron complex transport system permease protein
MSFSASEQAIILSLRLPRALAAALVGIALAASGVLFQGLLRNPMADPYIIGTSGGAALGATIAMMLPLSLAGVRFGLVPVFAFVGALATVMIVYRLALVGGQAPITTLLLAGFAVSSMLAAVMSFLMLISGRNIPNILIWLMGGVSTSGWNALGVVAPMILAGLGLSFFFTADLNALLLGEEAAAHLGVHVERRKIGLLALGSFLAATAVSISGLVGFVGLVMPHIARLAFGPEHRRLLPAAALMGGIFLVLADLLARLLLSPTELPVGMITAAVGAPFFLYLLKRTQTPYTF